MENLRWVSSRQYNEHQQTRLHIKDVRTILTVHANPHVTSSGRLYVGR